jgi:hypothetical protein
MKNKQVMMWYIMLVILTIWEILYAIFAGKCETQKDLIIVTVIAVGMLLGIFLGFIPKLVKK